MSNGSVPAASSVQQMSALEAIGTRRSIRWYEPDKSVERWKMQTILEAARIAPSAGNFNGQRAIVCHREEDPDIWEFISDWSQITTQMAPTLIFWCYDLAGYDVQGQSIHDLLRTGALDKAHGWEFDRVSAMFPLPAILPDAIMHRLAAIDLGNAIQNSMIAATSLGLATCLNGASGGARRNSKKYLNLPDTYVFCWLMTLGYPAENMDGGGTRSRPPFENMFFERKVGQPFKKDEQTTKLLEDLKLIQTPGPLPGRLEELNTLTKKMGLGDEWLTDWELAPSELGAKMGDKRMKALSDDEVKNTVKAGTETAFQLVPTVKRERLEEYRKEKGIGDAD